MIGDSWYFKETKAGFRVTFCRSCNENYNTYEERTDYYSKKLMRDDFFKPELIDSVSNYATVSLPPHPTHYSRKEMNAYLSELYAPDGILQFDVIVSKKWSKEKVEMTLAKNNQLKDSILREPLFKTSMDIFSDYRYWLPEDHLRSRTKGLDFYFERLPYESIIIDNAIFILHNKPSYFSKPMLVDKSDPEYFYKEENHLEDERRRTLKTIALVLGIHDYVILN